MQRYLKSGGIRRELFPDSGPNGGLPVFFQVPDNWLGSLTKIPGADVFAESVDGSLAGMPISFAIHRCFMWLMSFPILAQFVSNFVPTLTGQKKLSGLNPVG